jgi:integrase
MKVNLYLRDARSKTPTPVVIFARWNSCTLKVPTAVAILPRHWSASSQAAKSGLSGHQTFNLSLNDKVNRILTAHQQFMLNNEQREPTLSEMRARVAAALNTEPVATIDKPLDLLGYLDKHIERTRVRMQAGELRGRVRLDQFNALRENIAAFAKAKRLRLDFDAVDMDFYLRFKAYLSKDRGLATNTVGKYIRALKAVLNAAQDEQPQALPNFRSRKFKAPSELTDKVYLTASELNDLFKLDLSGSPHLERDRDLFLVGAWTGLRFSDWGSVTPEQIEGDRVRLTTQKTQRPVTIPLHSCVRAILNKYSNRLPVPVSNQKTNDALKVIAARVPSLQVEVYGRPKAAQVTTHTARRSFASNAAKGDGYIAPVPMRAIMAITGHSTEAQLRAYIRLDADEHADVFAQYITREPLLAVVA